MSDRASPESSTAALTACSACAASGISAERVTLENPTPLTATLHRFFHIWPFPSLPWSSPPATKLCNSPSLGRRRAREAKLRQGDVVVQLFENDLDAPPDPRLRVFGVQQIAGEQCAGRIVELDDDAGVGHRGREALVARVIHDRIGIDRSNAAYGFEFEVRRDALGAGCVRRMLEMAAALAALQFQITALGRIPERFRPLVRH